MTRKGPHPPPREPERRRNLTLREILEEFVAHARDIAARTAAMTPDERDEAQERLEWLADEVWRLASSTEAPPE